MKENWVLWVTKAYQNNNIHIIVWSGTMFSHTKESIGTNGNRSSPNGWMRNRLHIELSDTAGRGSKPNDERTTVWEYSRFNGMPSSVFNDREVVKKRPGREYINSYQKVSVLTKTLVAMLICRGVVWHGWRFRRSDEEKLIRAAIITNHMMDDIAFEMNWLSRLSGN